MIYLRYFLASLSIQKSTLKCAKVIIINGRRGSVLKGGVIRWLR